MDRPEGTAKCSGIPGPEPGAGEFALVFALPLYLSGCAVRRRAFLPFPGTCGVWGARGPPPPPPPFYPIPHPTPPLGGRGGHAGWRPFFSGDSETYSRA